MANYKCTYCQNPIFTCRIRCAECPEFDLCLQCFACGAEAGQHRKDHDYHVFDDGYFSIFETSDPEPWTANEEELLLEAVEQYGFGNWEDVGGHVKTKPAEECKEHYYAYFIHGNIGKATFPAERKHHKVTDHTCPDGGPLSPSLTTPLPPLELSLQEQQELGYMPLRDDFEREYDNDSETLVSGLSLNYDDEDIDISFKLAKADMYRQRLKERQRRKKLAREHGLIASATTLGAKKAQTNKKKISKEDRELQEKLRVFTQFHSAGEHEAIFESFSKERQLKVRIKELMRYRRNGITKIDEIPEYDGEKMRRDKKKENKKKLQNLSMAKRTSMASKKFDEKDGESRDDITGDKHSGGNNREVTASRDNDLLSDREKTLCQSIGMKPASYITIKTCIIRDYLQRRQGVPVKIRYPSHLDKKHRRQILNFLSENGWIGAVGTN